MLNLEGPYFQGKKFGQWVFRGTDGTVEYVTFKNDERVRGPVGDKATQGALFLAVGRAEALASRSRRIFGT